MEYMRQNTGCPVKLSTLWFCYFLGFQITYRRTSDHFSIAQEMRISKLTLLYFLCEKFIKLQDKTRDKLDFESNILMADFASFIEGVANFSVNNLKHSWINFQISFAHLALWFHSPPRAVPKTVLITLSKVDKTNLISIVNCK